MLICPLPNVLNRVDVCELALVYHRIHCHYCAVCMTAVNLHVRPPSLCRFAGALAQEDGIRWLNTLAPRHREFMVDMLAVRTAFIDQWLEGTLQLPRHSGVGSAPLACGASGNARFA